MTEPTQNTSGEGGTYPTGSPQRLIQRLEDAASGGLFICDADREEAVEIAAEEMARGRLKLCPEEGSDEHLCSFPSCTCAYQRLPYPAPSAAPAAKGGTEELPQGVPDRVVSAPHPHWTGMWVVGWLFSDREEGREAVRSLAIRAASPPPPAGAAGGGLGDTDQIVDWDELNHLFAQIPDGPWLVIRSTNHEIRQIDTDPTNKHHWPFRLCQSIAGQRASCDDAIFDFIAGVLNAWPQISACAPAGGGSGDLGALSAGAPKGPYRVEYTELGEGPDTRPIAFLMGPNDEYLLVDEDPKDFVDGAPSPILTYLSELDAAYRSGRLVEASAPNPDLGAQGEPVAEDLEATIRDAFARWRNSPGGAEFGIDSYPTFFAGYGCGLHHDDRPAPAAPRSGSGVTVEGIARAIDSVEVGYSINLKSLTEEGRVYTLDLGDGSELREFGDVEDAREYARTYWSSVRAKAVYTYLQAIDGSTASSALAKENQHLIQRNMQLGQDYEEMCDRAKVALLLSDAAIDILKERRRQIESELYTSEHDDAHHHGELANAAACYAARRQIWVGHEQRDHRGRATLIGATPLWPWPEAGPNWSASYRRDLIKSGALIVAEIERLDRAAPSQPHPAAQAGDGGGR